MTAEQLDELHRALWTLREYLDDEANVPDRFTSGLAGALAESDSDALLRAASVAHRLMLWTKFPHVSPESYLTKSDPEVVSRISDYTVNPYRHSIKAS